VKRLLAVAESALAPTPAPLRNPSVEPYYLPMDCPVCGRRRMEWDGKVLSCEKCNTSSEWDGFTEDSYPHTPATPAPLDGLREALERRLSEPTTTFRTSASRTLFDKAMRSPTQETTISAQALRMVLPAIEEQAVGQAIRAALAATPAAPLSLPRWGVTVCTDPGCGKLHHHVEEAR
jgi:hypothetical protein